MRERHPLHIAPGRADVDHAPVGEVGNRQLGDAPQRLLVIEGGAEQLAGLAQEPIELAQPGELDVQACVVEGQGRAARQLLDQDQVLGPVRALPQMEDRERAQRAAPRLQRSHQRRPIMQRPHELQVLVALRDLAQRLVGQLGQHLRAPGAEHARHGVGAVRVQRILAPQALEQLRVLRVGRHGGDRSLDPPVVAHQVDDRQLPHLGNRQGGHAAQRLARVQGAIEQRARLGQEPLCLLEAPAGRDVARDDRGPDDGALGVLERRDGDGDADRATVLGHPLGLVVVDALAGQDTIEDPALLAGAVGGDQDPDRLSDRLLRGVAVDPLGAGVPAGDDRVAILGDDRVVAVLDDRGEPLGLPGGALPSQFRGFRHG